jgi:hypothetical protein
VLCSTADGQLQGQHNNNNNKAKEVKHNVKEECRNHGRNKYKKE